MGWSCFGHLVLFGRISLLLWASLRMRRILRSAPKPQRPRVPNGTRVYAIGDVHGRLDLLGEIFSRIDADSAKSLALAG